MAQCVICGGFSIGTICGTCQFTADPGVLGKALGRLEQQQQRTASVNPSRSPAQSHTLIITEQAAGKVQPSGHPTLKRNLGNWVPRMVEFLRSRGYFASSSETSVGDQATPSGCEEGTCSLDFQGVRKGQGSEYYIDLQGQVGGGSTKRYTYAQVLIQTHVGEPSAELITRALLQSLQGTTGASKNPSGVRAVIHVAGASMPK